jgi:hypothetical protein
MGKITKVPNGPLIKKKGEFKGSTLKAGGTIKKAQYGIKNDSIKTKNDSILAKQRKINSDALKKISDDFAKKQLEKRRLELYRNKRKSSFKAGGMIKRADGSMSRRGLWDNIRANKGSGKKPTAAMLKQEKKIKAKSKK